VTTTATAHDTHHAPSPTGGGLRRLLLGPGLLRGAWMFVLFGGLFIDPSVPGADFSCQPYPE